MKIQVQLLPEALSDRSSSARSSSSSSSQQDDNALGASPVTSPSISSLHLEKSEPQIEIVPSFSPFTAYLEPSDMVISLKQAIHKQWSIHPKQQQLLYYGELLDDNELIGMYGVTNDDLVMVELVSASISLVVVGPTGLKMRVNNLDLNWKAECLRERATAGLESIQLKKNLALFFGINEVDWKEQLRTIQGLEDGKKLSTGIRLFIVNLDGKKVCYSKVDLNWTVKTLQKHIKGLTANQIDIGILTYKEKILIPDMVLRDVPDLDYDATLEFSFSEIGGYLV